MLGKIVVRRKRGQQRMRWLDGITDSMDMSFFNKFQEIMTPSNHLILCHPLLLFLSIFPSIMVFSIESALHIRWPKHWSFSFSISPSNEYSGLISFRSDSLISLQCKGLSRVFSRRLIFYKREKNNNREKTISLTSGAWKIGQPLVKE